MFDITHLHIEVSSKCVLKCPRCPRTELKEDHPQINRDYSLKEFQQVFDKSVMSRIKYMNFCGDIGDPIYATDFLDIVKYIKGNSDAQINIVTNGSYKSQDWWKELATTLDSNDRVTFSVDGWDHASNRLYRVNSDWDSIIAGVKTMKAHSQAIVRWSTIIFRFNAHRLTDIQRIADELGVDQIDVVRSSKFGSSDPRYLNNDGVDPLEPDSQKEDRVYRRTTIKSEKRFNMPVKATVDHWAKCLNGAQMPFVSVDGRFFPCAWFGSGYMENDFLEKYQDRINVRQRGLDAVINDPCWDELKMRWEMFPPQICKYKCKDGQ